jgi:hypothetical protein
MTDETKQPNQLFLHLVLSLESAAMYQMGKTVSPVSGKMERDLDQARVSIDMLTMLQEKTAGNLLDEEKRILDRVVYQLQMNYVDELNRDKEKDKEGEDKGPEDRPEQDGPAEAESSAGDKRGEIATEAEEKEEESQTGASRDESSSSG